MRRPKTVKLELTSTPSFPQTRLIYFQQVNFGSLHNHARCVQDSECQGRPKHFAQASKELNLCSLKYFNLSWLLHLPPLSILWFTFALRYCCMHIICTYVPLVKNLIRNSTRIILTARYSTSIYTKTTKLQKSVALFKMASVKKAVKSKGGGQKMALLIQVDGKNLITTIQVNLCCLISA